MNKRRIKRNFDEHAALVLENNEPQTMTPKKRQWRANMVWKKEDQIEHQANKPNKRKEPPSELAHHLDITPGVKRQVQQPNVESKPKQYVPSKRNWRYNRVWRKDMVWKRENPPAVPNSNTPTKTEKEKSTDGKHNAVTVETGKDNVVACEKGKDNSVARERGKDNSVAREKGKDNVVPEEKNKDNVVPEEKNKDNVVLSEKDKDNVNVVAGAKGKDNFVPDAKVITTNEPRVVNTVDNVIPTRKQEKITKRKRAISESTPCKKRLLEAIPWRSIQPHATPRFLWNLETEMEWVFTAFEDLRL